MKGEIPGVAEIDGASWVRGAAWVTEGWNGTEMERLTEVRAVRVFR